MLLEFEVGNYRSFHAPMRLSMLAVGAVKEYEEDNVFTANGQRLLKSAVIYGANASGKSNLLNAMVFMRWFILNSSKESQSKEQINVVPYKLDVDSEKAPSRFQIVFNLGEFRYRYGFEVDRKAVRSEWLFRARKAKESPLFLREGEGIEVKRSFPEGRGLEEKTRDNALFLSVTAQFNGKMAANILQWMNSMWPIHGPQGEPFEGVSIAMLKDEEQRKLLVDFVKQADLGIEDIQVTDSQTMWSLHRRYSGGQPEELMPFFFATAESEGTKKLLRLAGPILQCLKSGRIAIIDELDTKLHPLLTRALVRLFHSRETNPRNAQLIFATHDTNLLSHGEFRRDQVWFAEKTMKGATDLYSLVDIKLPDGGAKVRKDASVEKDYFRGRYGAIPLLKTLGGSEGLRGTTSSLENSR